jgi:hypothetical protein
MLLTRDIGGEPPISVLPKALHVSELPAPERNPRVRQLRHDGQRDPHHAILRLPYPAGPARCAALLHSRSCRYILVVVLAPAF